MKKAPRQRVNVRTHKAPKDGHKKTSAVVSTATKAGEAPRHARLGERTKGQSALATTVAEDELEERRRLFARARKGDKGADRKSTRLNSSHVRISYAVFCLKKKKRSNVTAIWLTIWNIEVYAR